MQISISMTTAEKSNQTGSGNTNSQQKSIKKKRGGRKEKENRLGLFLLTGEELSIREKKTPIPHENTKFFALPQLSGP